MQINPATLPQPLVMLCRALDAPAYLVGGAVRDLAWHFRAELAGDDTGRPLPFFLQQTDVDLATPLHPETVMQRLGDAGYRVIPTGIDHGTVTVIHGRGPHPLPWDVELTTFRHDLVCDGRHAQVAFATTLQEDLARRDFTFNALALDLADGTVIDEFDGLADLFARRVKTVGEAAARFTEDRLRMVRAIRFATRFEAEIEAATWQSLCAQAAAITVVSQERLRDELLKLLACPAPSRGIRLLNDSGLLQHILPELADCDGVEQNRFHHEDVFGHAVRVADRVPADRVLVRVAALLHDTGKPSAREVHPETGDYTFYRHELYGARQAETALRRLRFSGAELDRVTRLVRHHMFNLGEVPAPRTVRRWMRRVGDALVDDLLVLRQAELEAIQAGDAAPQTGTSLDELRAQVQQVREENAALKVADLAIGGNELLALGLKPGPRFKQLLEACLDQVVDNPALNTRETLLALVRDWLKRDAIPAPAKEND